MDRSNSIIRVFFLHHSTGGNLIKQGRCRELFTQKAPYIAFWDHGYDFDRFGSLQFLSRLEPQQFYGLRNGEGQCLDYSFHIPNHNTDPDGLAELFEQSVNNPPDNALSHILEFDVIIFKSCFPVTAISSEQQLESYMNYYMSIRNTIDKFPDKLFIPMTPPPLRKEATNPEKASRARRFSNWIMSKSYHEIHPNLIPFDFFDILASPSNGNTPNVLRSKFCGLIPFDSHPNVLANQTVAPIWVDFIVNATNKFFDTPSKMGKAHESVSIST